MLLTMIGEADWFIKTLALLFVWALDSLAYLLVSVSYNIFVAVSQLNIFATEEGSLIYDTIVSRLYMVISLAMVFVFAYFLIMMIIDPDGGAGKSTSNLVKQTIISLIVIAVLPTVYNYMAIFQQHVLQENTIGTIILGGNGLSGTNAGKNISMIVFTSFYHPKGSTYATFLDSDGTMRNKDTAVSECKANGAKEKVCESYYNGLKEWLEDTDNDDLYSVTGRKTLRHNIGEDDGMEYMWVLSTGCAIVVAYFFFSYAIDLGTRAVKLAFLQIISPVPLIMRVFPKSEKTFNTWLSEIKKTYIEVFIRVAVIFFIVLLCQYVPTFIGALWNANDTVEGGIVVKALATVALILGLLKFAKDAPDLFKTMFDTGGGLFSGLDFKPGMKRRIEDNSLAMKGMSAGLGGIGGMVGNMAMGAYNSYKKNSQSGDPKKNAVAAVRAAGAGLASAPRGLVSGARQGLKNSPNTLGDMGNSLGSGMDAAQNSLTRAQNSRNNFKEEVKDFWSNKGGYIKEHAADFGEKIEELGDKLTGQTAAGSAALATINKSTDTISKYMDLAGKAVEPYDKAFDDLRKKLIKGETVTYNGKTYSLNGAAITDTRTAEEIYKSEGYGKNAVGHYFNPHTSEYDEHYDPKTDKHYTEPRTIQTSTLKDLKEVFDSAKNTIIADTINDKYKSGGATYMATLKDQFEKELGNVGSSVVSEMNNKIKEMHIDGVANVNELLTQMSDKNNKITAEHIAALDKVKSTLSNQGKNIVINDQQKKEKDKESKGGK